MYTKGDFHMHTIESDGDYTPTEVVIMGREAGLDIMAITDHNSVGGVEEAVKAGEWLGIKVIPGMELSTRYGGKKVHILGYFANDIYKDKDFIRALRYVKKHDIKALKNFIGDPIQIRKDSEKERIDTQTGVDFIRYFGGCVVLAHPIRVKGGILDEILKIDFDGIEAIYSRHSEEQKNYYKNIAKEKGWIYTAGSDFHTDLRLDRRHGTLGSVSLNSVELDNFIIKCVTSDLKLREPLNGI